MATDTLINGSPEQIRVKLSTRHADLHLPEKTGPILISTSLKRNALSTLVNTLLESPAPIPFEFLINGQYLRTDLSSFLNQHGLSAENILDVEYIRALLPPVHQASFKHDDWISSIDVLSSTSPVCTWSDYTIPSGHERILSASYDGLLRVWDMSSSIIATSPAPDVSGVTSIKAARFISPTQIVSAGFDCRVRIWNYNDATPSEPSAGASIRPILDLYSHKATINHVSVHGPTSHILTASNDHNAALWTTDLDTAPPTSWIHPDLRSSTTSKRRKLASKAPTTPIRGPITLLSSHSRPVTAAVFHPADPTAAYTASLDATLKTWDLTTSTCISTLSPSSSSSHALLALTALPRLSLLAAGSSSTYITLSDPRAGARRTSVLSLRGHKRSVVALAAQTATGAADAGFGLVSGSHDGCVRVWDVRNAETAIGGGDGLGLGAGRVGKSIYRIPRAGKPDCDRVDGGLGVKVFDVVWDEVVGIVSAGEDRMVQVDRAADGVPAGV